MEDAECAELLRTLLGPGKSRSEVDATAAMITAACETRWGRNQACDAVIACGAVACVLAGAIRKFTLRPNGRRQDIDLIVAGDFLGFAPADSASFLEAASKDTLVASFTRKRIDDLSARFPAVSALMQNCAVDADRRLERHSLMRRRIMPQGRVHAYLAAMSRRI